MLTILNSKDIFKENPKSTIALGAWFLEQAKAANTPVDHKMLEGLLESLLIWQPRQLYDFFDKHGVEIGIYPTGGNFAYYNSIENHSFTADDRYTAEKLAITDAFKTLEQIL